MDKFVNRIKAVIFPLYLTLHSWIYGFFILGPYSHKKPVFHTKSINQNKTNTKLLDVMFSNHVIQFNDASCSVASVETVVNSIIDLSRESQNIGKLYQKKILEDVKVSNWKERVSKAGYKNRRGLPFPLLADAVRSTLEFYEIPFNRIEFVPLNSDLTNSDHEKRRLLQYLENLEKNNCFIIAHFNQGAYIRTWHLPHISPVGAYNPETKKVLVMDVDKHVKNPYWVDFNRFFRGLSWSYNPLIKKYGYWGGGYIVIKINNHP